MSAYLLAPLIAWVLAQTVKYILQALRTGNPKDLSFLYSSGNMPSAHTAAVVALAIAIGVRDGIDSPVFAMSVLFGAIVAYDAMNVRRAAGEQGLALRSLLEKAKVIVLPHHSLGHKPTEVMAGAVVGVAGALIALSVL